MADDGEDWRLDDVLEHAAWVRRLARRLVADAAERDDMVQEAWIEALRHRRRARVLRPWLSGLLRNVVRMEQRGAARRRTRETAVEPVDETAQSATTPEQMVARVEIERAVAEVLLELDEPYRSTLLWRYYDDLSAAEIARRSGVPAGTVRWRLKEGLERLRAKLDGRFDGDRRRWAIALLPSAVAARSGMSKVAIAIIGGALIMKVTTKTVAALVVVLLLVLGTMRLWHRIAPGNEVTRARPGAAWRVPGGIGAKAGGAATVAGVVVPPWFGQRGAPIRRIAGRVTFAGEPVANASVELGSELTDAGLIPPAKRKTGPDGRFDFGTQPPAKFSVAATAEGHGPAIVEADTRNPTTPTDKLELRLGGCESSLFGHVSDSSGGPIASAQVCLAPPRATACVIADAAGAYSICLSHRQDFVSVGAAGYGGIYDRVDFKGRRVQRDYSLTPEAVVVGRVVRADNNAPVARASVRVTAIDDQQRFAAPGATTTDAQGKFTVAGLAPGRQRIVAFADGLATSEALEINAEAGRQSGEVVLRLKPAARVSGVVTDGRDPVAGATVSFGSAGMPGPVDAVTQGDGSFVIDPVARGRATIFVSEHEVQDPKVVVIDRAEVSGLRVLVANMGSIAGRVSAVGKPLAGARVTCGRVEPVYTEEDGSFLIRGLAPDHYRVYADNPASGAFGYAAPDVTLTRGEHRTGVEVDVKYNGGISGVVVEPDGKPVGGVMVAFQGVHIPDGGNDVTAPDGTFWARDLLGGDDYRASVRTNARNFTKLRMQDAEGPIINVKDGATDVKDVRIVVLRDHLAISGTTVDGDGQPLGDVRVVAGGSDDPFGTVFNGWVDHPSAISAADGSFSIADLDSGTFVLQARGGDGSEGVLRGVAAGQKGVLVKVQRAGGVDGTLVGFASQPGVQAQRQIPGAFQPPVFATVEGDTFHFRGLSPGRYQIAAFGTDSDAQMVDVVAGQIATATLKSRGTATIRGRVVEWPSGAPVPGLRCFPGLRTSPSMPMWDPSSSVYCDDNGAFVIDNAPAGAVAVTCFGTGPSYSNGRAELTVTPGQDATCEIPVVKIAQEAAFGSIDAQIQPGPMPARFMTVTPRGIADRAGVRAGDIISTVDGASVLKLTPMGVQIVVLQRPVGAKVHLGLSRGDTQANADVVVGAQ